MLSHMKNGVNVAKRLSFFLSHLTISVCMALLVVSVVFFIWYPPPLAKAVGVTSIFLMLLVIDIIIGPVLSFLIYKEGKKTLKLDLTIIIVIQFLALAYGVYSIAQGRPVWLAYNVDRFEVTRQNDIVIENINEVLQQYRQPSWFKPEFVGVEFSKDRKIRSKDLLAETLGGISLTQKPERYVPLDKVKYQIHRHAQNLEILNQFNDKALVKKILFKYPQATGYVPLKSTAMDMTVLINKEDGEVVKIVDLRPWK